MQLTKQMARIYEMRLDGNDDFDDVKKAFANSTRGFEPKNIENLDEIVAGEIVIPLRGIFATMPLRVIDTAGLRQWKDDDGNLAGESRFFVVETLYKNGSEPTGLTFKLPIAVFKKI